MTNQEMVYIIAICILLVCAVTDWLTYEIWTPMLLCPVPVMLFLLQKDGAEIWKNILISMMVVGAFLFFHFFTRGQIGKGDCFLLGFVTIGMEGWQIVMVLFLSFVFAGIFGGLLMIVRKKGRKYQIPFAPFVLVGYVLTIGSNYL